MPEARSALLFRPALLRTLWILARPRGMVLVALLPLVGFSFAYWDHGCTMPAFVAAPRLLSLFALWAVPHMGTMWLNAALDRDEGPVLWGTPLPVPAGIERWAHATLIASVVAAFALHRGLGLCVLGCAVLSVLYSHPRTAWKGHAVLGPLANAIGYGVLSPLGGFLLADLPPSPRGAAVLGIGVACVLTAYFAAQAFQEREDRARGYRTLVALRGARATLDATFALLLLCSVLTLALAALGWFPRAVLAATPAFAEAARHLWRWRAQPEGGDVTWAHGFFARLAVAGLICVASVSAHYAWQERTGGPLGGLGTVAGQPEPPACPSEPRHVPKKMRSGVEPD